MDWLEPFFVKVWPFLTSLMKADLTATIILSFLTAGVGAGVGAFAAQWIAERKKTKDDLVKEIRATNAAVSITFDILNVFLASKKQHIGLVVAFEGAKAQLEQVLAAKRGGNPQAVFEFRMDLQSIPEILVPDERLQKIVFEKISIVGKPINLASVLVRSIHALGQSIAKRNQLIEKFREIDRDDHDTKTRLYFGLPDEHGHVDENYPSVMKAISNQTDDCIWFSKALIEELSKHGEKLKKTYEREFRGQPPNVTSVDLSLVEEGLLPPDENFVDWTKGFVEKDK